MGRMLSVKEVFATLQGEGSQAGRPAVFVRLSGCNLWSGLQSGRLTGSGACSRWCDTDFAHGERTEVDALIADVLCLSNGWESPFVVITGGEPCLQLRKPAGEAFVRQLQDHGVSVAVETNGTTPADVLNDPGVHVTVSPKALHAVTDDPLAHLVVRRGTDLKVVCPQWSTEQMRTMSGWLFEHRYAQPLDDGTPQGLRAAIETARALGWKVSVQTHKLIGLP